MKKLLLSLVIFSLIFAFAGVSLAQEQALEKISSPDQIKNFQVIKKEGNTLFGVRLIKPKPNQAKPEAVQVDGAQINQANYRLKISSATTTPPLEKIAHPADISLFDKIKKIGTALWGERRDDVQRLVYISPAAAQCVKDAIDKKDTALETSIMNHSQKLVSAINARNNCQKAAIDKTTAKEQFEANRECINAFKQETKNLNMNLEKERNEAHKMFRNDLQICSALQGNSAASSSPQASAGPIMIEDGENE